MRSRTILIVALAALTVLPAAPMALAWGGGSQSEPSTKEDRSAAGQAAMFQFANDGKTKPIAERVYFDGVLLHAVDPVLTVANYDPNLDGGRTTSPAENLFMAFLGYWRDCNGDGYIGDHYAPLGGGNLAQYPAATLDAAGLIRCPRGSPYNDGTLVDEFRWIGPGASPDPSNPNSDTCLGVAGQQLVKGCHNAQYDVSDTKARVWSDWGRPSEQFVPNSGIYPMPRGTFEDSTGTLKYVDDDTIGLNPNCNANGPSLSCTIDQTTGGPTWETKPCIGDQSNCLAPATVWPTFQVHRLTNDSNHDNERGNDIVSMWSYDPNTSNPDCSGFLVDPTGNGLFSIPSPNPRAGDKFSSDPTRYGSVDATEADNTRPFPALFGTSVEPGGCANDGGHDIFDAWPANNLEIDSAASLVGAAKTKIDQQYGFRADPRTDLLVPAGLPANMPTDGFTGSSSVCKIGGGCVIGNAPGWYANVVWTGRPPRAGFGSLKVAYHTFYAELSPQAIANDSYAGNSAAVALPAGVLGAHTYASENCPNGFGVGVMGTNGWSCDQTAWHQTVTGPNVIVAGEKYDLRDIDCYDDRVTSGTPGVTTLSPLDPQARACGN
ncbi:MAG: hypothetical protein ACYDCK_13675 [Thermoplasmatota archaeon]